MPLPPMVTEHLNRAMPRHGRSGETNQFATITGSMDMNELIELIHVVQGQKGRVLLESGALVLRFP